MRPDTTLFRQLPIVTNWRVTDNISSYRGIMLEHEMGYFMNSAVFWEEVLTDERISAVLDTRIDGLLSADVEFVPVDERRKSRQLAEVLGGADRTQDDGLWLQMLDPDNARELLKWYLGLGFCYGPITWATKDGKWIPRVTPWHPRFVRWDWGQWKFAVTSWNEPITYLPRTDEEPRGDGKWFVWGGYRSWMRGLVRSLGVPYLDRTWNQRDAARRSEKYGMGIVKGLTPPGNDTEDKRRFGNDLRNLGAEPTIICPQGENGAPGFDVQVVEMRGDGWQIFGDREKSLNTNIAVRILGQNLTTEVSGAGSLAAGKVHEMVRGDVKRSDSRFYVKARDQLLCWWAFYNIGDAEMAPYPRPCIAEPENPLQEAQEMLTVLTAIEKAPPELDVQAILEAHGLPVLEGEALAAKLNRLKAMLPPAPIIAPGAPGGAPTQQPGQEDQPADEEPTGESLQLSDAVSLSVGTGATRKRSKYQDAQAQKASRTAARTLRPFIQRVLAAVDSATSFDDVRRLIVAEARHRGADVAGLEKLVGQVNLLARLHGRESALANVLK